ncbi:MAG: hypothetical protein U0136_19620 [Bdellovibrionota bacterium]
MYTKYVMTAGIVGLIGASVLSPAAQADDSYMREETVTTQSTDLPAARSESEYHKEIRRESVTGGSLPEQDSATPPRAMLGSESTTTRTTSQTTTYRGTVRRIDPTHTVVIVDGVQYNVSGPQAPMLSEQVDKQVSIVGRVNQPTKTIEIERYSTSE